MARRALLLSILGVLGPGAPAHAVVGGTDAPARTYDAVANVSIGGAAGCTGTLVAPDWVLTAAHCGSLTGAVTDGALGTPIGLPGGAIAVTLGTTAASGAGGERRGVDEVRVSPRYLATRGEDVALLRLSQAATVAPVRIAGTRGAALWAPGVTATIAGFGATSERGDIPTRMQVARVPIVSDEKCAQAYPSSFEPRTQLCAGPDAGGVDSCQGDSGGPLFGHDGSGALKLVGATSYGDGCARPGRYGIYARVADSALREWIRSVVPSAIDDAATAASGSGGGGARGPGAAPARRAIRLVAVRAARTGSRLTLVVPRGGRLLVRWRAGGRTGQVGRDVRAGRLTVALRTPRGTRRVAVTATLRPASRGVTAGRAVLRVRR